jgi:hypothetical protein
MNSDHVNRLLTLGANIGVIAGIAFLALEIRQNSELLRLQFINDDLLATAESETPMLGDAPAEVMMKSIYSPREMTYADYRILDAYLTRKMELLIRRYRLGQEGILEEDAWKTTGFAYSWFFGYDLGRLWWKHEGRAAYSHVPELVEHVDSIVAELGDDGPTESWSQIQGELEIADTTN